MKKMIFLALALSACGQNTVVTPTNSAPIIPTSLTTPTANCAMITETLNLASGPTEFPKTGNFAEGKHHTTVKDTMNMDAHIANSCAILRQMDPSISEKCDEVYPTRAQRSWASIDRAMTRLPVLDEMFMGSLIFTTSTNQAKFLVTNPANGRSVVALIGSDRYSCREPQYLGTLSTEIHFLLKSDTFFVPVQIGRLVDQSLPLGPVTCEQNPNK